MKFANKLFLTTTALLTLIFTLFGCWMLSSDFSALLDREIKRGISESRMFRVLFEMGYQSTREYGEEYAVSRTLDSILKGVERDGSHCFVMDDEKWVHGGDYITEKGLQTEAEALREGLRGTAGSCYKVCRTEAGFFLINISVAETQTPVYLGMCQELTEIYGIRENLVTQYRTALGVLLLLGGVGIFVLSRYITKPISSLGRTAKRIADGNFELRSNNRSSDEIGQLARNFNRMADKLVEQMEAKILEAKQKEDFTAAFAHELKTPLTSIIGYADMMNTMRMSPEEQAESVYYIYSQGKRLESLSHKLLDLVSMDKNPIVLKPVSTARLEENIRATVRPIWEQRKIKGKVEMDRGFILGDEELLLSLFYNLLDNAAKAMDKGEMGFILLKGTALQGAYEVKVVDNGRGIPKDEIGRITEAFYMVDKSRSRKEGGAGIGMALCYKIINLHGGTLKIDSRLGEGTVMRVVFPMEAVSGRRKGIKEEKRVKEAGRSFL
ncbi:MAG: HAMP domain-containing histidine kinase [Butyrivibrio sp.]|nr:HAMP domain-containing histidine kinase [Acetatifactor muris]MCM1557923.1 HAMP domain-containing histidine kinase [Butyrivibrio sp.]